MACRAWRRTAALAALLVVVAGCELEVTAEMDVRADGTGNLAIVVETDPVLTAELDALRVDPFAEVMAAAVQEPGWQLSRQRTDDGGETVTLTRSAAQPAQLTQALRDLAAGLDDDDPALLLDLDLDVTPEGAVDLGGTAGIRLPATPGARGEAVAVTGDDVAALAAEGLRSQLRLRLPGPVVSHDADRVEDGALIWELPQQGLRTVVAVSEPPAPFPVLLVAVAAGLLLVAMMTWLLLRRR